MIWSSSAAGGSRSAHLVTGVLLCLTIIGIPLGLANFKLIPVSLRRSGATIVSIDEARSRGLPRRLPSDKRRRLYDEKEKT